MISRVATLCVVALGVTVFSFCTKNENEMSVRYLPVWKECEEKLLEFYSGYESESDIDIQYHKFPETAYVHPRLLGVLELSSANGRVGAHYPSVDCLVNTKISMNYTSAATMNPIVETMQKVRSTSSPNVAYIVLEKDKYTIYYSDADVDKKTEGNGKFE